MSEAGRKKVLVAVTASVEALMAGREDKGESLKPACTVKVSGDVDAWDAYVRFINPRTGKVAYLHMSIPGELGRLPKHELFSAIFMSRMPDKRWMDGLAVRACPKCRECVAIPVEDSDSGMFIGEDEAYELPKHDGCPE